jgi:hypothetical protein
LSGYSLLATNHTQCSSARNRAPNGDSSSAHRLEPTLAATPPPTVDSRRPLAEGRGPPRAVSLPAPETGPATEALRLLAAAALAACTPRDTHRYIHAKGNNSNTHSRKRSANCVPPSGDHGTHRFHHPQPTPSPKTAHKLHTSYTQATHKLHTSYTAHTAPNPRRGPIATHSSGSHLVTNACNHKQSCRGTCTSTHTFTMEAMEGLRPPLDADAWDAPSSPPPSPSPLTPSAAPSLPAPSLSFPASSVPALACTCDVPQQQDKT